MFSLAALELIKNPCEVTYRMAGSLTTPQPSSFKPVAVAVAPMTCGLGGGKAQMGGRQQPAGLPQADGRASGHR